MNVYHEGSVIVWVENSGKLFNDIKKADEYFHQSRLVCIKFGWDEPVWQRVQKIKRNK